LRVLQEVWMQELEEIGLEEVKPWPGVPPKAEPGHHDHTPPTPEGDVRPVRLGKSRKAAWIRLDGPRIERGCRGVEVLDQPLRTDAAIIAALTALEASVIEDTDFERLRETLLAHVEARRELEQKNLQEVLDALPPRWFSDRKTDIDEKIRQLSPEERKKRLPKPWRRWERYPLLWESSIRYMVALLRYRRPDFDDHTLEEQLDLMDRHRRHINKLLEKQSEHIKFLEYGTPQGTPRAVDLARDQVKAAVLADVEGLSHKEIANRLGVDVPDRYEINAKIPKITDLARDGREPLDEVLGEIEWRKHAEGMKVEGERYRSLSEVEKEIERLAENMGWTVERARSLYRTNPGAAKFLAHAY
jgi:predicted DNA-binding protein (UPF0251 family)